MMEYVDVERKELEEEFESAREFVLFKCLLAMGFFLLANSPETSVSQSLRSCENGGVGISKFFVSLVLGNLRAATIPLLLLSVIAIGQKPPALKKSRW
jgi:hypothetical protein